MTAAIGALGSRTFSSLRSSRNFRLFFAGQALSQPGTWMERLAQSWLVFQLTHSPVAVGVLSAAQFLPFLLFGVFGGVAVDRFDPRRVVWWTQVASMVLAAVMTATAVGGVATAAVIDAIAFLRGSILVLDSPARQALTYEMVGREELPNAVGLTTSLVNASRVIGPAIAGVVIASVGVDWCFALNTASYVAVLVGLALMRQSELHPLVRTERVRSVLGELREGFAYARRTPEVREALATLAVIAFLGLNFGVVLPVLAGRTLHAGAGTFGALFAAFGAGALAGALSSASLARARMRTVLLAGAVLSAGELALAPLHSAAAVGAVLVVVGFATSLYTAQTNALVQLATPDHLRGRILSLYFVAFAGTTPIGALVVGWLCARGGTELALAVSGAVGLVAVAVAAVRLRGRLERSGAAAGAA